MNILVTVNEGYIPPLKVMLYSLFRNHTGRITVYLMYSDIGETELERLTAFVGRHGHTLHPLPVESSDFADAPVNSYYAKEMYYRLLAHTMLPEGVDRVLYLDPDILVLNPVDALYRVNLEGYYYAAAAHEKPMLGYINKIRLKTESESYYNSGVLLMNVERLRREVEPETVFTFIHEHENEMILPDQDVLNGLFWEKIKPLDEVLFNYDARRYRSYLIGSKGFVSMDYIVINTVFLHFCGRQKPWQPGYSYRFGVLYKHYERLVERDEQEAAHLLSGLGTPWETPAVVEWKKSKKRAKKLIDKAV